MRCPESSGQITASPESPRITTETALLQHAAAAGITITPPGPTPPQASRQENHATPETAS